MRHYLILPCALALVHATGHTLLIAGHSVPALAIIGHGTLLAWSLIEVGLAFTRAAHDHQDHVHDQAE